MRFLGNTNAWTMPIKARIDMLSTGMRTPVGIKIFGADLERDPEDRRAARGDRRQGPGHPQRLRRARHRRLLRGHRAAARPARPLRPDHRRGAARDHDRRRRRERHDHDRGARALLGQHPLPARTARRPRAARARAGRGPRGAGDGLAAGAARAARRHHARLRAGDDPQRERLPLGVRLRRPGRAGHRRFRRGGQEGGRRAADAAPGVRAAVERAVREHDPRARAAQDRRAGHARADLRAALHEHPQRVQGRGGDAGGALLGDRRDLALLPPRLQRLDRGLGRHDRAARAGRRDRGLHAALPRPVVRRGEGRREAAERRPSSTRRSCTARSSAPARR